MLKLFNWLQRAARAVDDASRLKRFARSGPGGTSQAEVDALLLENAMLREYIERMLNIPPNERGMYDEEGKSLVR